MEKSLLARIRTLKLSYYGHTCIMRKANCLEKDIIQGCVPGSRGRGRPRRRRKEDISDWTGLRINDAALCWKVKNADWSDLFDDSGNFVYVDNGM